MIYKWNSTIRGLLCLASYVPLEVSQSVQLKLWSWSLLGLPEGAERASHRWHLSTTWFLTVISSPHCIRSFCIVQRKKQQILTLPHVHLWKPCYDLTSFTKSNSTMFTALHQGHGHCRGADPQCFNTIRSVRGTDWMHEGQGLDECLWPALTGDSSFRRSNCSHGLGTEFNALPHLLHMLGAPRAG